MTLNITVTVPQDEILAGGAAGYMDKAMSAIGFHRADFPRTTAAAPAPQAEPPAAAPVPAEAAPEPAKTRGRPKKADKPADPEPPMNISTGEERIDPTTPEDAAQDAEDEAAEVAATPAKAMTLDDVRAALTRYSQKFGMPSVMTDGPAILADLFGAEVKKVSQVPDTQEALAKCVAAIDAATAANPFKREAVK